jgi:hypothetical protein
MVRKLSVLLAVVVAFGVLAGTGLSANAKRLPVFGPNFQWSCDFTFSLGPKTPTGSYAVLHYNRGQNTVGGTLQLKRMAPNATFNVRLIQDLASCFTTVGTVTTNKQGNGTLHFSVAATSKKAAFLFQNTGTGTYFESDIFTHP